MKQYLDLCRFVLKNGNKREDRTNTGTISYFGYQMRFDLSEGFPLLTTKKTYFRAIVHELLWFISGSTNIKYLVDNNVKIWNEWPYENFKKSSDYQNETLEEFVEKVKSDSDFAIKHGELGPVYGKQWRDFNGVDQLKDLIISLKNNPNSRRHIINAWNASQVDDMALPPCHMMVQFYVHDNKLSAQLYQRSADIFLGVPFNIASYALFIHMIAQVCNLEVGEFVHTIGDAHIYLNHIDQIKTQLEREPLPLCQLVLNPEIKEIDEFKFEDIKIENYVSHAPIKGAISV